MANANIKAVITAEDRASQTLSKFGNHVDSVGKKITSTLKIAATAAAVAIGAGIVKNLDNAVKRLDTLNNSARAFENMGFAADSVQKNFKELDLSIRGLPTSLDQAVRGMTMLTASTNNIDKSRKVFSALNNAIIGFGGSAEQVDNAVIQLSQDLGSGRITAQTWLSLMNSGLTPALNAMAREMGLTIREFKENLSDGSISVEKFQDSLIKMNEKGGGGMKSFEKIAKDSTKGIQTSWANMNTAIARGIAKLLESIGRDKIAGMITGIGKGFEDVINTLIRFGPVLTEVGRKIGEHLGPKLEALWNTIRDDLLPVLARLWNEVLKPLVPVIGTILVGAVGVLIDALNVLVVIVASVTDFLLRNKEAVVALTVLLSPLAAAFIALKVSMAITAIIGGVTAAFGALSTATGVATAAMVKLSMVSIAGWAALVVADAYLVVKAFNTVRAAVRAADEQMKSSAMAVSSNAAADQTVRDAYKAGKISKAAHDKYFAGVAGARASGGSVVGGQPYLVGERGPEVIVPGQSGNVVPNNKLGGSINININAGALMGTDVEARKFAKIIMKHMQDIQGRKFGVA